jgi:two-component system OmpR family sensor kinase
MTRIVNDMNDVALMEDPDALQLTDLSVDRFVAAVATKAAPLVNGRLEVADPPAPAPLRADPQRLTQALINLLKNAGEHSSGDGAIHLRVRSEPHTWCFEVADSGVGVPPDLVEHIFQPFRSRRGSNGSGLGLAIVAGIAQAHGGSAGVESRPGEGARFWVRIPR